MLAATRSVYNYYWSFRRYIEAQLSGYKRIYNPVGIPKPGSDIDSWLIFITGQIDPKLFTRAKSQIHCVARDDEHSQDLMQIVSDVVAVFDNPETGLRNFSLYDKTTENAIGTIWIERIMVREQQPYSSGVSSILIDIYTRTKTARNAYAK